MPDRFPQGRIASWLARTFPSPLRGEARGGGIAGGGGTPDVRHASPPATKSYAPHFAFDRLGAPSWAPRDYAAFAREGYMANAILYRSVRMIAEAAASVPLLLYAGDEEITAHPLLDLLARPARTVSTPDLLEAWYGFLLISGNAYLEAVAVGSEIRELHPLRPDRMKVVPGADGWPEAFDYVVDGKARRIAREVLPGVASVLHVKLFHPANDHYGLSPIEAAAQAVDIHNTASRWNKALLDNSARPSGALVYTARDGNLTADQYDRLKAELEQGFQGAARAGRPLLLEGGLDWKSMSMSPKDMDFIEAKHVAAREIALAVGVPPMLLGIPGDNTYSNYQEATRSFWRQTVLPLVNRTAKALSAWLAPAYADVTLTAHADLPPLPVLHGERAGVRGSQRLVRGSQRLVRGSESVRGSQGLASGSQARDAASFVIPETAQRSSGTQGPHTPPLELRPDLDTIEALSTEREALWSRLEKSTFLTPNEKRIALGYAPLPGGDEIKSHPDALASSTDFAANAGFRVDQPRDDHGRGTDTGGGDGLVHEVSRRRGGRREGTPGQEARHAAARANARDAVRRLRELDPNWRGPQSAFPRDSIEGQIAHHEAVPRAAEARLAEILRDAIPNSNPSWGVSRLRRELHDRGYMLVQPARRGRGLVYENPNTGEQVRIMERPRSRHPGDPPEKYTFERYYRFRPGRHRQEGSHVPIPDRNEKQDFPKVFEP